MRHQQIILPQLTRINRYLIIVFGSIFLLDSVLLTTAGFSLKSMTALVGEHFFSGHIYNLVTYPLVADSFFEVLFDGLILWFIGSELEFIWGRKNYIGFLLATIFGGGLFFLSISLLFSGTTVSFGAFSGPGGIATALCVAFGVLFPSRVMFLLFFPLKAKYLVMIIVGANLYQCLFSSGMAGAWVLLGSCLSAFLWTINRTPWKDFWSFLSPRTKVPKRLHRFFIKDKKGRGLTLVPPSGDFEDSDGGEDDETVYH